MTRNLTFMRIKLIVTSLVFHFCFLSTVASAISFRKIELPKNATGPEAMAFEYTTGRFFTGIADGRILKYEGPTVGFVEFGYAAPNRSKSVCDGTDAAKPNPVCGRPLGMELHHQTKMLYFCDAFFGLGVLGPQGGLATQLSTAADGQTYRFCNGVDVHQRTGNVYFTDSSADYDISTIQTAKNVSHTTGRVLKYDVKTKQVTVLLRNVSIAAGVAVDEEENFVLVSELGASRILKVSLRSSVSQNVTNKLPFLDNIKRTGTDNFWASAATGPSLLPIGVKMNGNGTVLETVNLEQWYGTKKVSEVQEYAYQLYIASGSVDFIVADTTYCKLEYKNATYWEMPKSGPAVTDSDCITSANDKHKLCYDCKSCNRP